MFSDMTFTTDDDISHRLKLLIAFSSFFILQKNLFNNFFKIYLDFWTNFCKKVIESICNCNALADHSFRNAKGNRFL